MIVKWKIGMVDSVSISLLSFLFLCQDEVITQKDSFKMRCPARVVGTVSSTFRMNNPPLQDWWDHWVVLWKRQRGTPPFKSRSYIFPIEYNEIKKGRSNDVYVGHKQRKNLITENSNLWLRTERKTYSMRGFLYLSNHASRPMSINPHWN